VPLPIDAGNGLCGRWWTSSCRPLPHAAGSLMQPLPGQRKPHEEGGPVPRDRRGKIHASRGRPEECFQILKLFESGRSQGPLAGYGPDVLPKHVDVAGPGD